MTRNAVGAWDYFQIPPKRAVELGTRSSCDAYPGCGPLLSEHAQLEQRAARPAPRSGWTRCCRRMYRKDAFAMEAVIGVVQSTDTASACSPCSSGWEAIRVPN
jgi:hypothetical protein